MRPQLRRLFSALHYYGICLPCGWLLSVTGVLDPLGADLRTDDLQGFGNLPETKKAMDDINDKVLAALKALIEEATPELRDLQKTAAHALIAAAEMIAGCDHDLLAALRVLMATEVARDIAIAEATLVIARAEGRLSEPSRG